MSEHFEDNELCRTCLSRKELKPIFEESASNKATTTIVEMVKACATIQIFDGDGLPSSMCSRCVEDVQRAYYFKVKCEKADKILRSVDTLLFKDLLPLAVVKFENDYETAEQTTKPSENLTTESVADDNIFRCTKCLASFKSRSLLDSHVKKSCSSHNCALCAKSFSSKRFLQKHESSHSAKINTGLIKRKRIVGNKETATDEGTGNEEKENDTEFVSKTENDSTDNYNEIKEEIDADVDNTNDARDDSIKSDGESELATRKISRRRGAVDKQYLCTNCNSIFFNKVQLKVHLEKHSDNDCKPCEREFSNAEELHEHLVSEHRLQSGHRCAVCSKSFKRSSHLKQHAMVHTGDRPFVCDICSKQFSNSANLHRHRMIHTGERPHRCHVCNKAFIQGPSLAEHIRRHTGETPYLCNMCGVSFHSTSLLKVHMVKKHESDRAGEDGENRRRASNRARRRKASSGEHCAYVCNVCNRGYVTKGGLSVHLSTHDGGGKRFLCSECGKSFSTKMGLDLHANGHAGVKPFSCTACGKSFANSSALKHHTFVHTGEKPYKCAACGKTFSQGAHLRSHARTHSGERPYACSLCGKNFTQSGNMKQHMRIHTGEKLYACPVCEKRFNGSNNMRKHLKSHNKQKQQT